MWKRYFGLVIKGMETTLLVVALLTSLSCEEPANHDLKHGLRTFDLTIGRDFGRCISTYQLVHSVQQVGGEDNWLWAVQVPVDKMPKLEEHLKANSISPGEGWDVKPSATQPSSISRFDISSGWGRNIPKWWNLGDERSTRALFLQVRHKHNQIVSQNRYFFFNRDQGVVYIWIATP